MLTTSKSQMRERSSEHQKLSSQCSTMDTLPSSFRTFWNRCKSDIASIWLLEMAPQLWHVISWALSTLVLLSPPSTQSSSQPGSSMKSCNPWQAKQMNKFRTGLFTVLTQCHCSCHTWWGFTYSKGSCPYGTVFSWLGDEKDDKILQQGALDIFECQQVEFLGLSCCTSSGDIAEWFFDQWCILTIQWRFYINALAFCTLDILVFVGTKWAILFNMMNPRCSFQESSLSEFYFHLQSLVHICLATHVHAHVVDSGLNVAWNMTFDHFEKFSL